MSENKIFYLAQPDLGDLMSTILGESSKKNENRRLVFTEYRPATCGFYNHIGIPEKNKKDIIKWLNEQINTGKNNYSNILDAIIERSKSAHRTATGSDFDAPNLKPDILDLWEKILVSLKEKYGESTDTYNILSKLRCSNSKDEITKEKIEPLYNALRIFSENMPSPSNTGRVGKKEVHDWEEVPTEVDKFEIVAVFEYFFGMRASPNGNSWQLNFHARINVFLDTGEYVGQIIAFAHPNTKDDVKTKAKLLEKAEVAACLVRNILPGIRQARYMNAILRGGSGDIDRIMVHHLPYLFPVTEFFVRLYNDGSEAISWPNFFEEFEKKPIWFYSSRVSEDNYYHDIIHNKKNLFLEPYSFDKLSSEGKKHPSIQKISEYLQKNSTRLNDSEAKGFVTTIKLGTTAQNILFCFSTEGKSEGIKHVRVIAVIDNRFLPAEVIENIDQYCKQNLHEHEHLDKANAVRSFLFQSIIGGKNLAARLNATIATMLKPEEGIVAQIRATSKEETYAERYGTVIYKKGYLGGINSDSSVFNIIKRHIDNTEAQLTNPLFAPRGFRNMASTIYWQFFDELWKYFNNGRKDVKPEEPPLRKLLYNALDFEESLKLSPGYREHFIHSYHVFLLGIYLIDSLDCLSSHKNAKNSYQKWFLASMYHDIGYPIEKIEDISKNYLKKLLSENGGDDIQCKISIDNGMMLLNDGFINSFNELIEKFVDNFFDFNDRIRSSLHKELIPDKKLIFNKEPIADTKTIESYKSDVKNKFTRLSYGALTKDADHGIFSALLFLNAAKQTGGNFIKPRSSGDNKDELDSNDIMDIALAIFSHNTLDRSKAPGHKWHLAEKDCNAILDGKSIKFDFSVFCYNIYTEAEKKKKKIDNWLASLLILCDSFSQWGRTTRKDDEKDDKNSVYLVPRQRGNQHPKVCLCYPKLKKKEDARERFRRFYDPQLSTILSDRCEKNLFQLYINPPEKQCPTMRSDNKDISECLNGQIDTDCISIVRRNYCSIGDKPESSAYMHEFDKEAWSKG